jgi:hypothetical protein
MPAADLLNAAGLAATSIGSVLGMVGVFKQTNAYYAFRKADLVAHMFQIALKWLTAKQAFKEVSIAAKLAEKKVEDRAQSLAGLYLVFFGFLLQLVGAGLLFAGVFAGPTSSR